MSLATGQSGCLLAMPDQQPPYNPFALIDAFEPIRDQLAGMVSTLVADGFSPEQARAVVVAVWVTCSKAVPDA